MKCAAHPDADAVGYCRNCGKALCAVCVRPVRDVLHCEDCLANLLGHTSPAQAHSRGEISVDPLQAWSKERPIGPIILIGAGVLFLLYNFDIFPFYRIERFWPLILIAVGVLMFRNRLAGRS